MRKKESQFKKEIARKLLKNHISRRDISIRLGISYQTVKEWEGIFKKENKK